MRKADPRACFRIYMPPTPATYTFTRDVVMLSTIDGNSIACRTFLPFAHTGSAPGRTILVSHGNADDIGSCASYCQWLADSLDSRVVTYDYVNYGCSTQKPTSEENMAHAIEAAYGYILSSLEVPVDKLFLCGKSLGSVPTLFLASQPYVGRVAGIILVSAIASGARVVLGNRMPAAVMSVLDDAFAPNVKRIRLVKRPVLLVHGTLDDVVPLQNAHDLFNNVPRAFEFPPLWVQAGHNDIESLHKGLFVSTLQAFMEDCDPSSPPLLELFDRGDTRREFIERI